MKLLFSLTIALLLSGCATKKHEDVKPTPFVHNKLPAFGYDYIFIEGNENIGAAAFFGNENTSSDKALIYSSFAAYKYCEEKNLATQVMETKPVKASYQPYYQTSFLCLKEFFVIDGLSGGEEITRELVNPYTNDFKGGILIKKDSAPFKVNDVVIKVNNKRVQTMDEVNEARDKTKKKQIPVTVIRSGKPINLNAKIVDKVPFLKETNKQMITLICLNFHEDRPAYCNKFVKN